MKDQVPRVSIGLPVYNGEEYLPEALDSLLGQTYGDFELIISDNGSTDGTQALCEHYASLDARVQYHRSETNRGAGWNFANVFHLSRGEYFKWAAHDDIVAPTYVERCVEVLDREPDVVWCHSQFAEIGADGQPLMGDAARPISYVEPARASNGSRKSRSQRPHRGSPKSHQRYQGILLGGDACLDYYALIRSSSMRKTGLHRPYYGADRVFIAELSLMGRYAEVPETLFFYRCHARQSVWLASQHAQEEWLQAAATPRRHLPRQVRCAIGQLLLIPRADLPIRERFLCLMAWLQFATAARKWKRLFVDTLRALGVRVAVPEDAKHMLAQQSTKSTEMSKVSL